MSQVQEFQLQMPKMMNPRFHIEKSGKGFPDFEQSLYNDDKIEFFDEEDKMWRKAVVKSWTIDDGSGNAPGVDAHYFVSFEVDAKKWKIDLHHEMKVKIDAPTDEELASQPKFCMELIEDMEGTAFNAPTYTHCYKEAQKYVSPTGYEVWSCAEHKPSWITSEANA